MWGALPYGSFNGAYNTVEENVGAYNTVRVRVFCRVLFLQVHRVWSLVSWFDLRVLACFLRSPLAPSERASPVGWPQSEKSDEQGFYAPRSKTRCQSQK